MDNFVIKQVTETSVTYAGTSELKAYYFTAIDQEDATIFIACLDVETENAIIGIKRIECDNDKEAWALVSKWGRIYGMDDAY